MSEAFRSFPFSSAAQEQDTPEVVLRSEHVAVVLAGNRPPGGDSVPDSLFSDEQRGGRKRL